MKSISLLQAERPLILDASIPLSVLVAPQPTSNHPSDSLELVRNLGEQLVTSPPGFESPQSSRHKRTRNNQSQAPSGQSDSSGSDSSSSSESSGREDVLATNNSPEQNSSQREVFEVDGDIHIQDANEPPSKKRSLGSHRKITWIPPPPTSMQQVPIANGKLNEVRPTTGFQTSRDIVDAISEKTLPY